MAELTAVLEFLRAKGFVQAEQALQREAKTPAAAPAGAGTAPPGAHVAAATAAPPFAGPLLSAPGGPHLTAAPTAPGPGRGQDDDDARQTLAQAHAAQYDRLAAWVDGALDLHRPELQRALYPCFFHSYLRCVEAGGAGAGTGGMVGGVAEEDDAEEEEREGGGVGGGGGGGGAAAAGGADKSGAAGENGGGGGGKPSSALLPPPSSAAGALMRRHRQRLIDAAATLAVASERAAELRELAVLRDAAAVARSPLARSARAGRAPVRLCAYAFDMLLRFLHGSGLALALGVVNDHLKLDVYEGPPELLLRAAQAAGGAAGAFGAAGGGALEDDDDDEDQDGGGEGGGGRDPLAREDGSSDPAADTLLMRRLGAGGAGRGRGGAGGLGGDAAAAAAAAANGPDPLTTNAQPVKLGLLAGNLEDAWAVARVAAEEDDWEKANRINAARLALQTRADERAEKERQDKEAAAAERQKKAAAAGAGDKEKPQATTPQKGGKGGGKGGGGGGGGKQSGGGAQPGGAAGEGQGGGGADKDGADEGAAGDDAAGAPAAGADGGGGTTTKQQQQQAGPTTTKKQRLAREKAVAAVRARRDELLATRIAGWVPLAEPSDETRAAYFADLDARVEVGVPPAAVAAREALALAQQQQQQQQAGAPPAADAPPSSGDPGGLSSGGASLRGAAAAALLPPVLPSIGFFTFVNTHRGLCSAAFSSDAALAAGGFDDSSVRLYDMRALARARQEASARLARGRERAAERQQVGASAAEQQQQQDAKRRGGAGGAGAGARAVRQGGGGGAAAADPFAPEEGDPAAVAYEPDEVAERLDDAARAAAVTHLCGHTAAVHGLDFSSDRRLLLSASADGTLRAWAPLLGGGGAGNGTFSGVRRRPALAAYRGHVHPVWAVACPQLPVGGHYFASGGADRAARVWCSERSSPLRLLVAGGQSDVAAVAWHPNGQYLATGGTDRAVRLWDVATGGCVRVLPPQGVGEGGNGLGGGGGLGGLGGGGAGGAPAPAAPPPLSAAGAAAVAGVTSLAFAPDGRTLAVGSGDGAVGVYDLGTGRRRAALPGAHDGPVWALCYSRGSGAVLASGGADECVRLWSAPRSAGSMVPLVGVIPGAGTTGAAQDAAWFWGGVPAAAPGGGGGGAPAAGGAGGAAAPAAAAAGGRKAQGGAGGKAKGGAAASQQHQQQQQQQQHKAARQQQQQPQPPPPYECAGLAAYPTRAAPVVALAFTPRNLLLAGGPFHVLGGGVV